MHAFRPELLPLTEGCRFEIDVDPEDPRFDIVRMRIGARLEGETPTRPVREEGHAAAIWACSYYLSQAAQCLVQLGAAETAGAVSEIARVWRTVMHARAAERARAESR
jgi:hypothetical protein